MRYRSVYLWLICLVLLIVASSMSIASTLPTCGLPCFDSKKMMLGVRARNNLCIDIYTYVSQRYCCFDEDCGPGDRCINGRCQNYISPNMIEPMRAITIREQQIYYTPPTNDKINILIAVDNPNFEIEEIITSLFDAIPLSAMPGEDESAKLSKALEYFKRFNFLVTNKPISCNARTCDKTRIYNDPLFNKIDIIFIFSENAENDRCNDKSGRFVVLKIPESKEENELRKLKGKFLKYIGFLFGLSDEFDANPYFSSVAPYRNLFESLSECKNLEGVKSEEIEKQFCIIEQLECEKIAEKYRISKLMRAAISEEITEKITPDIMRWNEEAEPQLFFNSWNIRRIAFVLEHIDNKQSLLQSKICPTSS